MTRALHLVSLPHPDDFATPAMRPDVQEHVLFQPLFFELGSGELTEVSRDRLADMAGVLEGYASQDHIEVRGHADDGLGRAEERSLSQARAATVLGALEELGVRPGLLAPKGLGSTQPSNQGRAPFAQAVNRRVEIVMVTTHLEQEVAA